MKALLKIVTITLFTLGLFACQQHPENKSQEATASKPATEAPKPPAKIKVGVVLPLEHKALQEIVDGFKDTIRTAYPDPIEVKVMNAQGDMNMQRAIIQQMRDQHYAMIIPVATGATQMTVSMVHNIPIVALAAEFTEQDRQKLKPCNIAVVHDEIPPTQTVEFIHAAYPNIKHLVLIHSTADQIYPQVKNTVAAGKQSGIEIKPVMVATLPEMVSAAQALPDNTQGILILKDNLIASGVSTLANVANTKHIPLITSDQGSVQVAAGFALGVHERQIGEVGAKLAAAVIANDSICTIPIVEMKRKLTVFINPDALKKENQDQKPIEAAAKKLNYTVEFLGAGK